jgi:hypothetical protein
VSLLVEDVQPITLFGPARFGGFHELQEILSVASFNARRLSFAGSSSGPSLEHPEACSPGRTAAAP